MNEINDPTSENTHNLGVFSLPSLESESTTQASDDGQQWRKGASAANLNTLEHSDINSEMIHQESEDDHLPMITWLRGDEPWFSQFDMDADAVMRTLGIKRSRLTQIAGRDLRVGRVRVDRYIRPIFRSIDVASYLERTRATASHQKSSDAIKLATESLRQQINQFESTLETINSNLISQVQSIFGSLIAEATADVNASQSRRIDSLESDMVNRLSVNTQETVIKYADLIGKQISASRDDALANANSTKLGLKAILDNHQQQLETILSRFDLLSERLERAECLLATSSKDSSKSFDMIFSELTDLKNIEQSYSAIAANNTLSLMTNSANADSKNFKFKNRPTRRRRPT